MPYMSADGVGLHYEVYGSEGAPWVTLIHGGLVDGRSWENQVPVLQDEHQVLIYDIRGYGGSGKPSEGYSLERSAADLRALHDHVGVHRGFILGFSQGGMIAQLYAQANPGRVRALILQSTTGGVPAEGRESFLQRAQKIRSGGIEEEVSAHVPLAFSPSFRRQEPALMDWYREQVRSNDPNAFAATLEAIAAFDNWGNLGRITCPTLVLAGEKDEAIPTSAARRLADELPDGHFHIVPDVGHTIHYECPDRFNEIVMSFFGDVGDVAM